MKHLDLFSGIGGFALAAQWVWESDYDIIAFCEIDKFCQQVLNKHWPEVPIYEDIKEFKPQGAIDLLTGGFPCQPYSLAGKRKGSEDDRALWPEMFRVIQETRPAWIVGENVAGFVDMGLDDCLADLEGEGYKTQAFIIPACAVDAKHRRNRVWIVANSTGIGCSKQIIFSKQSRRAEFGRTGQGRISDIRSGDQTTVANSKSEGLEGWNLAGELQQPLRGSWEDSKPFTGIWLPEPSVGRVANGVSRRVDRLKGLGNAIVPQVAEQIFRAIKEAMR